MRECPIFNTQNEMLVFYFDCHTFLNFAEQFSNLRNKNKTRFIQVSIFGAYFAQIQTMSKLFMLTKSTCYLYFQMFFILNGRSAANWVIY